MATNTNGFTGLDSKMVSDDSFLIVGIDPNTDPSCTIDESGRARTDFTLSATEGMTQWPAAYPEVRAVDNSGAHHGGTYSVVAMNKFSVDAASGGISLNTCGNISLYGLGGIVNIVSSAQIEILSDVVKIDSMGYTIIDGPFCDINSEIFTVKNLSIFASNSVVNGSMLVKGELYTTHITGMKDKYYTKPCKPQAVYYYPRSKFKGIMKVKNILPGTPWMPNTAICDIEMLLPDRMMLMQPLCYTFPHRHRFYHLAASLCSSTNEVWAESEQMANEAHAKAAKSAENCKAMLGEFVESKVKDLTQTIVRQGIL